MQDIQSHSTVFTLLSKCPNGLFTSIISLTIAFTIPWAIAVFVSKNREDFVPSFEIAIALPIRDHPHDRNRSTNRMCKWTLKALLFLTI